MHGSHVGNARTVAEAIADGIAREARAGHEAGWLFVLAGVTEHGDDFVLSVEKDPEATRN